MKSALSVRDLHIQRSPTFCLDIPELKVAPHNILCVAGPNGSGKSTFINCIVGLLGQDTGEVIVAGHPISSNILVLKTLLGYVPDDEDWFIKELCAGEYLELMASVYKDAGVTIDLVKNYKALAKELYFTIFDQPLQSLSHGNKKKVQIIAALMHNPKVIVFDEVRNGLDPLAIIATERLMRMRAASGACIIATTHDLWWAERMATNVLLLIDGKPALELDAKDISSRYGNLEHIFMKLVAKSRGEL